MKRRQVLAGLGTPALATLTGCLSGDPPADGGKTTSTTTPNPTTAQSDPTTTTDKKPDWNPGSETPFETVDVGSREDVAFPANNKAHPLRIWNSADSARQLTLSLETDEEDCFERTMAFPADGWLELFVEEPGDYTLEIAIDGSSAGTVEISRSRFDCNDSRTDVVVADGEVHSTTITTLLGCPGAGLVKQSFLQGEGSCGDADEASVEFAEEAVQVAGQIIAPNPCYELELESAELENAKGFGDDGDLVVTVAATNQREGVCVSCVGAVPYEVTVGFENAYPKSVRVVHRSMDEKRTVATVERS